MMQILILCVDFLEKDKDYHLASLLLTYLLISNLPTSSKRKSKLFLRLVINLKHLKLNSESKKVANFAALLTEETTGASFALKK